MNITRVETGKSWRSRGTVRLPRESAFGVKGARPFKMHFFSPLTSVRGALGLLLQTYSAAQISVAGLHRHEGPNRRTLRKSATSPAWEITPPPEDGAPTPPPTSDPRGCRSDGRPRISQAGRALTSSQLMGGGSFQ